MERVVVDPGVLMSALIATRGNPAELRQAVVDQRLEIVICPRLRAELAAVLEEAEDISAFDAAMAEEGDNIPWEQVKADLGWS